MKKSKIRVILGDHDASTNNEVPAMMRAVSAVIRHKNFDTDTYNHDIALLKLRKPVVFTKQIRPICLPKVSDMKPFKKNKSGLLNKIAYASESYRTIPDDKIKTY